MIRLSAVIITFNEEDTIGRCVDSLEGLADDIVVLDSLSTDRTPEICRGKQCRFFQQPFAGYSRQKQDAVDLALHDWVLSFDADEVMTPELKAEIQHFLRSGSPGVNGWYIRRDLVYLGRRMRFGGGSNEKILRLFNRKHGRFDGALVHEKVIATGPVATMKGHFLHYSYRDSSHHLARIMEYTNIAAEEQARKGKRVPRIAVPVKFMAAFIRSYVLQGGILEGYAGFLWAFMGGIYSAMKAVRTIERTEPRPRP